MDGGNVSNVVPFYGRGQTLLARKMNPNIAFIAK